LFFARDSGLLPSILERKEGSRELAGKATLWGEKERYADLSLGGVKKIPSVEGEKIKKEGPFLKLLC